MNFWMFGPVAQKVTINFYSVDNSVKQCTDFIKVSSASSPKLTDVLNHNVCAWVSNGLLLNGSASKIVATFAIL